MPLKHDPQLRSMADCAPHSLQAAAAMNLDLYQIPVRVKVAELIYVNKWPISRGLLQNPVFRWPAVGTKKRGQNKAARASGLSQ